MAITPIPFGRTPDGQAVTAWKIHDGGCGVTVLDYGATVQSLIVPDGSGMPVDVALGYDTAEEYVRNDGYLGATIGRVGNRIGGARFSLGGVSYELAKNDGVNHLHGGVRGFDKQFWHVEPKGENALICSRLSPDGEEGYPGALHVSVTYTLAEGALSIRYDGETDKDTLVNLTNHTYFNLNGGGTVLEHELQIFAERFCENDNGCLPTGTLLPVEGTPFDFRTPKAIGRDIDADNEQLRRGGGYDHNFVLSGKKAAVLYSPQSRIEMTVETDMPGMQAYSANGLSQRAGKGGSMAPRHALCLETQLFPNAMQCYGFPSPVLRAGRHLSSETVYRFRVR